MSPPRPGTADRPYEQLALTRGQVRRAQPKPPPVSAAENPVARVLVDVALAHLDRPFDYLVTEDLAGVAQPGCRVRVRFAGKEVGGYILERTESSEHGGRLAPLRRLVSPVPVLTPAVSLLCRHVADRYAGVVTDVLRLAVPPRHARVERERSQPDDYPARVGPEHDDDRAREVADSVWASYQAGQAYLDRLRSGLHPRAVWTAVPGSDWTSALAEVATATLQGGRGSIVCVPDQRAVHRLTAEVRRRLGGRADKAVAVTAELGPAARYRAFLRALTGESRIVVGTRSAAFAPVRDLGLVAIWDDGDDLHAEPRAPYPHAREVLAIRARLEGTAMLLGGFARTTESQQLIESGWAQPLSPRRAVLRAAVPRVHVTGDSDHELARDPAARHARLPRRALEVARAALTGGPVLVQVPRAGYLAALGCVRCRHPARCAHCRGGLMLGEGQRLARCGWCGRSAEDWRCGQCGATRFRAPVVGSQRTAEELGRAFPQVPVITSSGGEVRESVAAEPAVVVATPGAEPVVAEGHYHAALILDTRLTLGRPDLRTSEESLRRWLAAAALVRPAAEGGSVVVVGDAAAAAIQSLVRWDPGGAAERELADRASTLLPPAARVASLTGPTDALADFVKSLAPTPRAQIMGPVPQDAGAARAIVRVPPEDGPALSAALKAVQATRSARKLTHVRVQVDPTELG